MSPESRRPGRRSANQHAQTELESGLVEGFSRWGQHTKAQQILPGLFLHHMPQDEMGQRQRCPIGVRPRPTSREEHPDGTGVRYPIPQPDGQGGSDKFGCVPVPQQDLTQVVTPSGEGSSQLANTGIDLGSQDRVRDGGKQSLLVGMVPIDGGGLDPERITDATHGQVRQTVLVKDLE